MPIQNIFEVVQVLKQNIENLSVDDLKRETEANPDLLLLDIREIQERIDRGSIPGAVHCPRGMMEFWASPTSPYYRDYFAEDRRTVVFCAGGGRSVLATVALMNMGFTSVDHLEAGFGGWQQAGEPVEDVSKKSRWMRKPTTQD